MKLILSVMRDNKCVEKITLDPPKEATIGRRCATGLADKQFDDDRLSRQHFRISPEGDEWLLQDLKSLNGTKVQGKLVNSCLLSHGDKIQAGMLAFQVELVGTYTGTDHSTSMGSGTGDRRNTPASISDPDGVFEIACMASRGKLELACSLEQGESGQSFFSGGMSGLKSAAELLLALRQNKAFRKPWLIVDPSRLENPIPEPFAKTAVAVVDWLGSAYADGISPRIINLAGAPYPDWEALVSEAWGSDSIMVLFSNQSQDELLAVLRKAVRQGTAISGVLWPSVLSYMLLKANSGPAKQLMSACQSILMELPDLPDMWVLIGPPELQKYLQRLGMTFPNPMESAGTKTG